MSIASPANKQELLYQEFIASRLIYKMSKKRCNHLPDDDPQKAEMLKKLREFKRKLDTIDHHFQKHIDYYANLMDPEINHSLSEEDIMLLRKELKEVKKSLEAMQE